MLEKKELYQQHPTIAYRKFHKKGYDSSERFIQFRHWFSTNHDYLRRLFLRDHDYDRYLFEVWAQERYYYFLYNRYVYDVKREISMLTR